MTTELRDQIAKHLSILQQIAPHMQERETVLLLKRALEAIAQLEHDNANHICALNLLEAADRMKKARKLAQRYVNPAFDTLVARIIVLVGEKHPEITMPLDHARILTSGIIKQNNTLKELEAQS